MRVREVQVRTNGCAKIGCGLAGGRGERNERLAMTRALGVFSVLVVATLSLAFVASCTSGPGPADDRSYTKEIEDTRAAKDAMFKSGAESPIPQDKRAAFTSLTYYPIDPAYRVPAHLKRDATASAVIIEMDTSTNQRRRMRRVGVLSFTVGGAAQTLTAFADMEAGDVNRLFVPFRDETSGGETYGGGRYIELERTPTGLYDLDFNKAYHPFCVYSSTYDCPLPPRENRLAVAVRAGEKLGPTH